MVDNGSQAHRPPPPHAKRTSKQPKPARATTQGRKKIKPREETAQRREDILEAAVETFGAKGYGGSLGEIARAAGMTHAGVLHHYGSKQNLLIEALEYRDKIDVEDLEGRAAPSGMELFHHLCHTAVLNAGRPSFVRTYAVVSAESITDDHPAQEYFRQRFVGLRTMLESALTQGLGEQAAGRERDIALAAQAVIGVMDGLQIQWLLDPDNIDLAESTQWAITAIVRSFFPQWT